MKIGITSDIINTHTFNHWQTAAEGIHKRVADVVAKNGSLPFILPIVDSKLIERYLQAVDGIIITGGCDIDPQFYHEKPLGERKRDLFEIKLVHRAIQEHKPVLGLCRGLQVINVALGGTLYQNIMDSA
ncbi:MAG: gamma-glutamyl-gamma-aminobutyrate hydrolase family protein [Acetilactobacillus jinshanensis]